MAPVNQKELKDKRKDLTSSQIQAVPLTMCVTGPTQRVISSGASAAAPSALIQPRTLARRHPESVVAWLRSGQSKADIRGAFLNLFHVLFGIFVNQRW